MHFINMQIKTRVRNEYGRQKLHVAEVLPHNRSLKTN